MAQRQCKRFRIGSACLRHIPGRLVAGDGCITKAEAIGDCSDDVWKTIENTAKDDLLDDFLRMGCTSKIGDELFDRPVVIADGNRESIEDKERKAAGQIDQQLTVGRICPTPLFMSGRRDDIRRPSSKVLTLNAELRLDRADLAVRPSQEDETNSRASLNDSKQIVTFRPVGIIKSDGDDPPLLVEPAGKQWQDFAARCTRQENFAESSALLEEPTSDLSRERVCQCWPRHVGDIDVDESAWKVLGRLCEP
ncbi:hypothetical protein AB4Z25_11535 [Rhizobium sp. RAF36]|uniref:hypothetical protein n=1 Tax=Rhizobium sp. RAF36 TaxID=3233055 RepID=UPI000DD6BDE2